MIKPFEAIDLSEDKEIVIYVPEEKAEAEEYSDWTDEDWQRFSLHSFMNDEDESFSYQMMKHQEETGFAKKVLGNEKED
ncbi:MAG: hypothetical protein JJE19_06515, partial [Methanosarcinales archaeon]|nr:hypothetical protein [Methanosarcinales archaeon]